MKTFRNIIPAFIVLIFTFSVSSCWFGGINGSGKQVTQVRSLRDFHEIAVDGAYKLIIKQDTGFSVKVTADDNLLQYINTDLNGDQLHIYNDHTILNAKSMTVQVNLPDLSLIKTAGAVVVQSLGHIEAKDVTLDLAGTTKVNLDISAASLTTGCSGLTELNLKGQASSHSLTVSGSANVNAFDFVVAKYTIETSGASTCKINVLSSLNINSSGLSVIQYKGNPTDVENNKSGASTLTHVN